MVTMPVIRGMDVGKIVTQLVVTNRGDQILAARGAIPTNEIRSVTLDNVIVDTGATTLCLSADTIAQLGLEMLRDVRILTANGPGRARIFQDAKISLLGREGTFECLELPGGTDPLIGVIPLEALGVELNLQEQTVRLLPDNSDDTFYTIYALA